MIHIDERRELVIRSEKIHPVLNGREIWVTGFGNDSKAFLTFWDEEITFRIPFTIYEASWDYVKEVMDGDMVFDESKLSKPYLSSEAQQ